MQRVLVSGGNRGPGLVFVRQCLARGDLVFAVGKLVRGAGTLQMVGGKAPELS